MSDADKPGMLARFGLGRLSGDQLKNVIEKAREQDMQQRGKFIIDQIQANMKILRDAEEGARIANMRIEFYKRRIAALDAGQFTIDNTDQIMFDDDELNPRDR